MLVPQCLKSREVERLTGLSRSTILRLRNAGEFPPPHRLAQGSRAHAWLRSDVHAWLHSREVA